MTGYDFHRTPRRNWFWNVVVLYAAVVALVLSVLWSTGCGGALQGGTVGGLFEKPQKPVTLPDPVVHFALSLDVPDALVVLARKDDQPATTVQTAPARYGITTAGVHADVPHIDANVIVTAPGYVPYREPLKFVQPDGFCKVGPIPASGDYDLCDVVIQPALPVSLP